VPKVVRTDVTESRLLGGYREGAAEVSVFNGLTPIPGRY
jgi:hypothetical protein